MVYNDRQENWNHLKAHLYGKIVKAHELQLIHTKDCAGNPQGLLHSTDKCYTTELHPSPTLGNIKQELELVCILGKKSRMYWYISKQAAL